MAPDKKENCGIFGIFGDPEAVQKTYFGLYNWFVDHLHACERKGLPPEAVARCVQRAMTDPKPPSSIVVSRHPNLLYRIFLQLPSWFMDRIYRGRSKRWEKMA